MIFTNFYFYFYLFFLIITMILFKNNSIRKILLLSSNLFFYGFLNLKFLLLIIFQSITVYVLAKLSNKYASNNVRKKLLLISICMNLLLLIYFKYLNWFIDSFKLFFDFNNNYSFLEIGIPLGISFYTFRLISYSVDIYKRTILTSKSNIDFFVYSTFFPLIIAGPIERPADFLPQLNKIQINSMNIVNGSKLIIIGLFLKVFVADNISSYVNFFYENYSVFDTFTSWLAVFSYSIQIYADFAGYSNIAIGISLCLGIIIKDNFNYPYSSKNIKEFWKKWHISLSTWIRDYIYIPLGGNKCSEQRKYLNLLLSMTICGLWHGAGLNYIIWGFIHGLYLIIYNSYDKQNISFGRFSGIVLTFLSVSLGWIFFRAETYNKAIKIIIQLFSFKHGITWHPSIISVIFLLTLFLNYLHITNSKYIDFKRNSNYAIFILLCLLWITFVFFPKDFQPFVYAQF